MEVLTQFIGELAGVQLFIRREDLIHPVISGNKFRKLKYTIEKVLQNQKTTVVTFGGAHSNHIVAAAYAAQVNGLKAVGVIRGDELIDSSKWSPTLIQAAGFGMQMQFVSRTTYRTLKYDSDYWLQRYPDAEIIPEGGTSQLAVKGCSEILSALDEQFDFVFCAVGTGGTVSGLINTNLKQPKIIGVPVLKGDFLREDICKFATNSNWDLINDYEFGGYGKITPELITFINTFYQKFNVPLDPVYTGKAMFALIDKIHQNFFPKGTKVLFIHTGGLQGITAMNRLLSQKNQPLIDVHV